MGLEALLTTQIIGLQPLIDAKLGGSTGSTDNRILRADGTGGSTVQNSAVTIDDSGNISGIARLDSTRAGSMGSTNPQNQIILYGGFAGYGIGFDANGELTTCVNSARRSTLGMHMNLGSSGQLRFNSASDLSGSWDTLIVRNATGPTVETRAAGGLRVRSADGTAAAAIDCGAITASGTSTINSIPAGGGLVLVPSATHNAFHGLRLCSTSAASERAVFLVQPTSGEIMIGANNGGGYYPVIYSNGAQALGFATTGAATFAKTVSVGTYTFGTLPAAASNAGALAQITDSSVTTNGTIAAGGGSDRAIVFSDGTDWIVAVA